MKMEVQVLVSVGGFQHTVIPNGGQPCKGTLCVVLRSSATFGGDQLKTGADIGEQNYAYCHIVCLKEWQPVVSILRMVDEVCGWNM